MNFNSNAFLIWLTTAAVLCACGFGLACTNERSNAALSKRAETEWKENFSDLKKIMEEDGYKVYLREGQWVVQKLTSMPKPLFHQKELMVDLDQPPPYELTNSPKRLP